MKPGVYIHIPFCEQRCYYCAFTVSVSAGDTYEPYVRRLIREIQLSGFDQAPETIFFGGGTPSIIDGELIRSILRNFSPGASEITIETNPGTLTDAKLHQYRAAGVNRISLGVQSFKDEDLKNAGRLHSSADVFRDIASVRKCGFDNLSVDLIAGLLHQRIEVWHENLKMLLDVRPEHVSIYMLDVEERSAWGKPGTDIPDDDVFAGFYMEAVETLAAAGYVHYEISNWALPGYECRHNLKYWTGVPYRGFGVSAHSFNPSPSGRGRRAAAGEGLRSTPPTRFWNTTSLKEYADMIDAGKLPISGEEHLTREMRLEEAFMIGLRRTSGFDIWRVAEELDIQYPQSWFDRVCELEDAGWVRFDGKVLKLNPAGWLLASGVTEELLCPTLLSTLEATP